MPMRIGSVALPGLQAVYAVENRTLVEQRVPGAQGSVFQDLGREPVTLRLQGWILGETAGDDIEALRSAHARAEPQSFAADIAVGSELVDVIIQDLDIRQPAGWRMRYWFETVVREYQQPPEPAGAGQAAVDAEVAVDADVWSADNVAALGGLADPSSLGSLLGGSPDLLSQLTSGDLMDAITGALDDLTSLDLQAIMDVVAKIDPQKVGDLVNKLKDANSLGEVLGIFAKDGLALFSDLTGIDTGMLDALVTLATGGLDFIKQAKKVGEAAIDLFGKLAGFNPLAGVTGDGTTAGEIVEKLAELLEEVDELLQQQTAKKLIDLASELGLEQQINDAITTLDGKLDDFGAWLDENLSPILRQLQAAKGLLALLDPLLGAVDHLLEGGDELLDAAGLGERLRPTAAIGAIVTNARGFLDEGRQLLENLPKPEHLDAVVEQLNALGVTLMAYADAKVQP